jgi:hypothetical protein
MTISTLYYRPDSLPDDQKTQISNYVNNAIATGQTIGGRTAPNVDQTPYSIYSVIIWTTLENAQNFQTFLSQFNLPANYLQEFNVTTVATYDRSSTAAEQQALGTLTLQQMGSPVGDPASCLTHGASYPSTGDGVTMYTRYWATIQAANDYAALLASFDPTVPVAIS